MIQGDLWLTMLPGNFSAKMSELMYIVISIAGYEL